jgi:hypothetical protein
VTKPGVMIITGASGLMMLAVAFKQFHSSPPTDGSSSPTRSQKLASLPNPERSGWVSHGDTTGVEGNDESGPGSSSSPNRAMPAGHGGFGRPMGEDTGRSEPGAATGAATVIGGHRRSGAAEYRGQPSYGDVSGAGALRADGGVPIGSAPADGTHRLGIDHSQSGQPATTSANTANGAPAAVDPATGEKQPPSDQPVYEMKFDANSTAPDKTDTAPVVQEGVTIEGPQGATFNSDSQFVVPNEGHVSGDAGSIAFTLQPQWGGEDQSDASLFQLREPNVWDNRLQIFKNGDFLRFLLTDNTGSETNVGAMVNGWQANDPHQITATWGRGDQGQGVMQFYIDGNMVGQQNFDGQLELNPNGSIYIGSDLPGGISGANATLSQLKIYNRQLQQGEIGNQTQVSQ